ncbi:uncharacterized protein [Cicer arietinum]|uniref:Uncharacterized protein DDB_G0283697 n=1 Tax=Cicer arietinum TaxID=3827 RepID=A0A1S2Z8V0_CICAR|nr:uncharacterized protein DDB_G0283697 [Cicer arietinum]
MGKSSGSLKKKHSNNSSKVKASSKSKSRKHKSKKVRRHEVSLSSSDYDDSKIMDTSVSSSSEDRSRRKRDRSRTRKDVKGCKKKVRRLSCSSDSSDEGSLHGRKRKKVKRKNKYDETKLKVKSRKKKKVRREASVSSVSSGSRSCSTCPGGIDSDGKSEYESLRGRTNRKEEDRKTDRKEKGKRRWRGRSGSAKSSRYRPRSCSPCCSPRGESSYEDTEEKYVSENKSRWLRSVITVAKEVDESIELCGNETKEEVVDDLDYPCRSNDSNDGGTKRELDHYTHPAPEKESRPEDETSNMNADVNFKEPKHRDTSKDYSNGTSESMKKEASDTSGANLDGVDMESILRQRALENLRKFRGEVQSSAKASEQKNKIVSQVKQPITDNKELVQDESNINNVDITKKFNKQTPVEEISLPVGRTDLAAYERNNGRILNMDKDISGSAKIQTPEKVIDADNNRSKVVTESTNIKASNLELNPSESCHDSLHSRSSLKGVTVSRLTREKLVLADSIINKSTSEAAHVTNHGSNDNVKDIREISSAGPKPLIHGPKFKDNNNLDKVQDEASDHSQFKTKQTSDSREPSDAKLLVSDADEERNAAKTTQSSIQNTNRSGIDVEKSCNAATTEAGFKSSSIENNSGKVHDESKQGSQFEQKTMNVMRGGEMVQVNYKVYIPKKTPALARRQLKR